MRSFPAEGGDGATRRGGVEQTPAAAAGEPACGGARRPSAAVLGGTRRRAAEPTRRRPTLGPAEATRRRPTLGPTEAAPPGGAARPCSPGPPPAPLQSRPRSARPTGMAPLWGVPAVFNEYANGPPNTAPRATTPVRARRRPQVTGQVRPQQQPDRPRHPRRHHRRPQPGQPMRRLVEQIHRPDGGHADGPAASSPRATHRSLLAHMARGAAGGDQPHLWPGPERPFVVRVDDALAEAKSQPPTSNHDPHRTSPARVRVGAGRPAGHHRARRPGAERRPAAATTTCVPISEPKRRSSPVGPHRPAVLAAPPPTLPVSLPVRRPKPL